MNQHVASLQAGSFHVVVAQRQDGWHAEVYTPHRSAYESTKGWDLHRTLAQAASCRSATAAANRFLRELDKQGRAPTAGKRFEPVTVAQTVAA